MNEIAGLREAFKQSRIVFLTTFSDGGENSRQMTNLNENPYQTMWFPTYRNTQKIRDIEENPKVLITFPSSRDGEYYEIVGRAEFEDDAVTAQKWRWWYLYWHPHQKMRFSFRYMDHTPDRVIINVKPESAKIVRSS